MKSIKEKSEAYDKVLEWATEAHKVCDGMLKEDLEHLFPELKESEDERIRENIIATIHLYYGEPLEDEAKEMIAWLERRGQTFTKKDVDDAYLKGVCDAKHELEKQGKNNMGISEATKQKLEDNLNKALEKETPESWSEFLEKQGEQKPWSEEDEDILNTIINHFKVDIECTDDDDIIKWLKSIKDRVQSQNTWKPSNEQMKLLREVQQALLGKDCHNRFVVFMHELKRLREE